MLQEEALELCRKALCGLLGAQPVLIDLVASHGHLPRLCRYLATNPHHVLPILHTISSNHVSNLEGIMFMFHLIFIK